METQAHEKKNLPKVTHIQMCNSYDIRTLALKFHTTCSVGRCFAGRTALWGMACTEAKGLHSPTVRQVCRHSFSEAKLLPLPRHPPYWKVSQAMDEPL